MRKISVLSALLFFASSLSAAELWTGELFDANCVDHHKEAQKYESCIPGAQTLEFTLQISGRMLKLDTDGDRKAAHALKDYTNRTRVVDPDIKTKPVTATVEGTVSGDAIKVDSIELR